MLRTLVVDSAIELAVGSRLAERPETMICGPYDTAVEHARQNAWISFAS